MQNIRNRRTECNVHEEEESQQSLFMEKPKL